MDGISELATRVRNGEKVEPFLTADQRRAVNALMRSLGDDVKDIKASYWNGNHVFLQYRAYPALDWCEDRKQHPLGLTCGRPLREHTFGGAMRFIGR